jgi:methionyl-tRNA formyltransferase/LmbE family N-acetylglucosaminyl deacetylase
VSERTSFAFLGGVVEGQEVLHDLLAHGGWRPRIVLALADEVLRAASGGVPWPDGAIDGIPVVKVPAFQSAEAWYALGASGVRGALAVGISEILRRPFLDAFPLGVYGFHASLLPALAGPAPVNWAIIEGRSETGTTLLRYSEDVDGGTIVGQRACAIDARETAGTLYAKLAGESARLWLEHWPRIACDEVPPQPLGRLPQSLRRWPEDGLIRWNAHSAASLDRWVRALARPYPGAYFRVGGRRVWVHRVDRLDAVSDTGAGAGAGAAKVTLEAGGPEELTVAFPDGRLRLSELVLDDGGPVPGELASALEAATGRSPAALHTGRRVLVVAAHPDDEVLGAGGTQIRHFKSGDEVRALIVCSAAPIRYHDGEHDQPGDTRRALHYLGAEGKGLGFADQRLDEGSNLALIQAVEAEVQAFRPQVVYTHFRGDVNADHGRIAEAVDVAVRPFAAPFVEELYAFETPSSTEWTAGGRTRGFVPNTFVDISAELERKLHAMRCYRSELRPYPHPRSLRALRERAGVWGGAANQPATEALMLLRARR